MRLPLSALALLALTPWAAAQTVVPLLRVGDAVPGAGLVTGFRDLHVYSNGVWRAIVDTDDPLVGSVAMLNGQVLVKVGDSPPALGGALIASLDFATAETLGFEAWLVQVAGAGYPKAVIVDGHPVLAVGSPLAAFAHDFPAGSLWRRFEDARFGEWSNRLLLRGAIDVPTAGASDLDFVAAAYENVPGNLSGVIKVALESEAAPGLTRAIEGVRPDLGAAYMSPEGMGLVWTCDLEGPSLDDACVYLSNQYGLPVEHRLIAREGSSSPVPGRTWGPLEDLFVHANRDGRWTIRTLLDGSDPGDDELLVDTGVVVAREGSPLPATDPWPLESLGSGGGILDRYGRTLWYARWDDPGTPVVDEALFFDGTPLVRTGVTSVGSSVVIDLESGAGSYVHDLLAGRFVLFVGSLSDGTRGLFRLERKSGAAKYCTAKQSSAGCMPDMSWAGQLPSASAGLGFTLRATDLKPKQLALFLYGVDGAAALPFHGGTMCVASPLQRFGAASSQGNLSAGCSGWLAADFNAWIASGVDPDLVAGARVWAQAWFRDPGFAPPENVGLTDAVHFLIGL